MAHAQCASGGACTAGQWCNVYPIGGSVRPGSPFTSTYNGWGRFFFVHDTGFIYAPSFQGNQTGDGTYGVKKGIAGCYYGNKTDACNPDNAHSPQWGPFSSDMNFTLVATDGSGNPACYTDSPFTEFSSSGVVADLTVVRNGYTLAALNTVGGPLHLAQDLAADGTSLTVCYGTYENNPNCTIHGFTVPSSGVVAVDDEIIDYSACAAYDATPTLLANCQDKTAVKWVLTVAQTCPQPGGSSPCRGQRQGAAGNLAAYLHPAASSSNNAWVYLASPKVYDATVTGNVLYGARFNTSGTWNVLNFSYGDNTVNGALDQRMDGHPTAGSGDYDVSRGKIWSAFGYFTEQNGYQPFTYYKCIYAPAQGPADKCLTADIAKGWQKVPLANAGGVSGENNVGGHEGDSTYVCGTQSSGVCSYDLIFYYGGLNTGGFAGSSSAGYVFCLAETATHSQVPACYDNNVPYGQTINGHAAGNYIYRRWVPVTSTVSASDALNGQWLHGQGNWNRAAGSCTPSSGAPDGRCHGNAGIRDGARLIYDPDDKLVLIYGGRTQNGSPGTVYWTSVAQWNPLTNDYCLSDTAQAGAIIGVNIPTAGTGSNYAVNDELTVVQTGGSGGTVIVTTVDSGTGAVKAVKIGRVGAGYTVANSLSTTGGSGSGATVNIGQINTEFSGEIGAGRCNLPTRTGTPPTDTAYNYFPASTWDNNAGVAAAYGDSGKGVLLVYKNDENSGGGLFAYSPTLNQWTRITGVIGGPPPTQLDSAYQPGKILVHDDIQNILFAFHTYPSGNSTDLWEIADSALSGVQPDIFDLTVYGSGTGTVSDPQGYISCTPLAYPSVGAQCSHPYVSGATVTLTAQPSGGSTFAGWSVSGCSGATCTVTMDADKNVTATFNPPPVSGATTYSGMSIQGVQVQ